MLSKFYSLDFGLNAVEMLFKLQMPGKMEYTGSKLRYICVN